MHLTNYLIHFYLNNNLKYFTLKNLTYLQNGKSSEVVYRYAYPL